MLLLEITTKTWYVNDSKISGEIHREKKKHWYSKVLQSTFKPSNKFYSHLKVLYS